MNIDSIYKKIVNTTAQAIWVVNKDNDILFMNNSMLSMLGFEEEELTGVSILNLIHTSDKKKVLKNISEGKKGISGNIEVRLINRDGRYIRAAVSTNPVIDDHGDYEGSFGIVTDIGKNKKLSENITEQDEYLKLLFYNNPNAMWIYDKETFRFLEVNHAAELIYGYTSEEFLQMQITDIRPAEDIPLIFEYLRITPTVLRPSYNVRHKLKDGSIIFVDIISHDIQFRGKKASLITISNASARHKILEALEKSEEKYRTLFENAGTAIAYCDPDGTIQLINETGAKYFGQDPSQAQGKNIAQFLVKDMQTPVSDTFAEVIRTRKSVEREDFTKDENNWFCYSSKFQPLIDYRGHVYGVQVTFDDITERKKSEKILRESETRFRHLFEDIAQIPVQGYNSCHEVIFWNKASEIAYGYAKNEAVGKKLEDLIIPGHLKDDVYNAIEDFFRRDIPIPSGEIGLKRKDGSIVTMFSSHVIIKNYNGNKEMYCVDVDMSKRIEAERQVALQARILNSVGEAVIVFDNHGNIIYVNDASEQLYGWKKEEMMGSTLIATISNKKSKEDVDALIRLSKAGQSWSGERFGKKKNGTVFPVYVTTSPMYNVCDEIVATIAVSIDISDLKLKEKELQEAKEKAEEMSKIKSAFLTNMSHELRTPLMGILGFSEILNEELKNDVHKELAGGILLSSRRLHTTLNAILDLSKIEANMMEVNYSWFNVISEVTSLIKVFQVLAAKKNIKIDLECDSADFEAELDKYLFIQVMENLIHNALKFTEKGSVSISIKQEISNFTVKVSDTGIGILKESLDIVFDEFRQVSEGYGRSFDGSGIGLTITKRFVQLMDGIIYVESKVNEGSTFTVSLPVKRIEKKKQLFPIY